MARLPFPETGTEQNDWIQRLKEQRNGRFGNVFRQIAHSPEGAFTVSQIGVFLRKGIALPAPLRELAILAIARVTECDYEWSHHVAIARRIGVADDKINAVVTGKMDALDETETAVVEYATVAGKTARVDASVIERLREKLSDREVAELAITVGYYSMIARILLPFEVPLDDFVEQLSARETVS